MAPDPASLNASDPGISVLVALLHFHGIGADAEQLRHQFGTNAIGVPEILRCARDLGLKARAYRSKWDRLATTPLPGIAVLRDGSFLLLGKAGEDKVIVQFPAESRPRMMTQAELEAIWDGELILMTRPQAELLQSTHRIRHFLPTVRRLHKFFHCDQPR